MLGSGSTKLIQPWSRKAGGSVEHDPHLSCDNIRELFARPKERELLWREKERARLDSIAAALAGFGGLPQPAPGAIALS
jgi:hypothetical protein